MAAAKGKKNEAVKWAIGGAEPDDLPDFQSNDDIVKKNKGKLPPKGRTRVLIKKVTSKENKNGDQMLTVTCEVAEGTPKKPGAFDGYTMWERLNVTEQGAPYLKRFLTAIGVKWADFIKKTVADTTQDPTVINKIGNVTFGGKKPVEAWVSIKHGTDQNDDEVAEVGRFLPPADEDDDDVADDEAEEDEDDDDVEVDEDDEDTDDDDEDSDDEDDDEDDEEDEDEEDGDAEAELRDELKGLKLPALKKRALRAGADEDDMPGKKPALIDLIVELELGEDEEDEDEDEADEDEDAVDEDELREELSELSIQELRDRAKENGRKAPDLKGKKKPAIIDMIVEDEVAPF